MNTKYDLTTGDSIYITNTDYVTVKKIYNGYIIGDLNSDVEKGKVSKNIMFDSEFISESLKKHLGVKNVYIDYTVDIEGSPNTISIMCTDEIDTQERFNIVKAMSDISEVIAGKDKLVTQFYNFNAFSLNHITDDLKFESVMNNFLNILKEYESKIR